MTCGIEIGGAGKYHFHAGFGNQGFLYCSRDTTVLTFSSYDSFYRRLFENLRGRAEHPWVYAWEEDAEALRLIEQNLIECPCGGSFSFENPLRCPKCGGDFSEPLSKTVYYVVLERILDGDKIKVWKDV